MLSVCKKEKDTALQYKIGTVWGKDVESEVSETLSTIKKGRGIFYKFYKWQFAILVAVLILKKPEI